MLSGLIAHYSRLAAANDNTASDDDDAVTDQLADLDFAQTLGEYVTNGLETPLTTVEQAFEDLEDSFDAAKDKARELGLSVSDVTDMFGELRTELVDQVSDDFTARLRAAQGNGFLNNLQGVLDQRAIDGRNATAAGLDIDATAGAIAAESFHRILEALDASQLALAAGAFTDDAMLSGLIAHYSRLAAANDNTASDDDDAVTDQPIVDPVRLVVADLADVLGDMDDALNDSIAAREAEIDAIRAAATAAGRVGRALIATADSVLIDSSLSPLSVEDRLAEARSQYEAVLARAAGEGDDAERAREELNAISRAYLDAAQDFYGSSTEYSDTFERVQTDLRSIGDAQLSIERAQLAALEAIETEIAAWRDALAGAGAASNVFGTSYTTQTDGQAISNTGMDLGADPERNLAILGLLRAAGLPTPSGFGEGQLRALREADPRVHDLLAANGFARGGAFDGGKVIPFARGGVIARPTHFPIGLMGEAGPEAIMPLRRDGAGRLGVSANTEGGAASPAVLAELKAMTTRLEAIEANTGASARTAQREAARPLRAAGGVR
jgi:tetratricopeptide (TPR) repeat protein